jgi:hypothetical protein
MRVMAEQRRQPAERVIGMHTDVEEQRLAGDFRAGAEKPDLGIGSLPALERASSPSSAACGGG